MAVGGEKPSFSPRACATANDYSAGDKKKVNLAARAGVGQSWQLLCGAWFTSQPAISAIPGYGLPHLFQ